MRSLAAQVVRQLPTAASLRLDGDLLSGFLTHGTEDDFAELVRRHGPLVWGACRRALPDPADAEDAFQATFLVLLRRGRKLTNYPTIGPWLHKVAAWTARNVRRRNARRLARQSTLHDQFPTPIIDADLPLDIDAALLSLPEKFRSPIVLCHLLGYSRADAAERLGCAEGTLSAWLSRGLARLRARFGGLDPAKPLGVAALAVPAILSTSVVRAAVGSRLAAATTAAVSSTVSQVVEGVIRMFWIQKATAASMGACVVFALGVGVGMSGRHVEGVAEGQERLQTSAAPAPLPGTDREERIRLLEERLSQAGIRWRKATELIQIIGDKDGIERFQKIADEAATEAKELLGRLEAELKAAEKQRGKPLQKPNEPKTDLERIARFLDDEIADTQKRLARVEEVLLHVEDGVEKVKMKIKLSEGQKNIPEAQKLDDLITLSRFESSRADALAEVRLLKDKLAKLKASTVQAKKLDIDLYRRRAELEAVRAAKQNMLEVRRAQLEEYRAKLAILPRYIEEEEQALKRVEKELADVTAKQPAVAAKAAGYLELTVRGTAAQYEFALRELDAAGKEVVALVVKDATLNGAMLARVLARTKADPTAPAEMRVIAAPPTAQGIGQQAALKACDAAGYKTVKFTGYIMVGGFTRNLKPDDRGEVPGYRYYDSAETTAERLDKEIELGRRTW